MGAFDAELYALGRRFAAAAESEPGAPAYPGDWRAENSNRELVFPWGRACRNPRFIGPFRQIHLNLPLDF